VAHHPRSVDAALTRVVLKIQRTAGMNAGRLARIDQRLDLVLQVLPSCLPSFRIDDI
jgi:hypothetical protein